jgi:hypothetical protein
MNTTVENVLVVVVTLGALWAILGPKKYGETVIRWAIGVVGLILGYILKH